MGYNQSLPISRTSIDAGELPMRVQAVPVVPSSTADDPARHLRGRWLVVARVAWIALALLTVVYFVASQPSMFVQFQQVCTGSQCPSGAFSVEHVHELAAMG